MLRIQAMMNSSCEEVLGFKTCCGLNMRDQNLEIHLTNKGREALYIKSIIDLTVNNTITRIDTLTPQGPMKLDPGQLAAMYCCIDEELWQSADSLTMYDESGTSYDLKLKDPLPK